jgi:RNA polymerase sigma factor (sigma-70 family)
LPLTRDEYVTQLLAIKRSSLRAWVWAVTHDTQSLDDLSQDVYEQLLAVPDGEVSIIASVRGYARAVCRNRAMNWLRARRNRHSVIEYVDTCDVYADERQSPEVILRARERLDDVRYALEKLTDRRRVVLVLNRMYGFTAKEIAMQLGIRVPTVRRLLYDAALSFEDLLNRDDTAEHLRLLQQTFGAKE